jgi:predicted CXXCH cytochrome family protein
MKWLVRTITRRPRGQAVNRDELVEATELGLGRGTDNLVHVPDLRLSYHHAVIRPTPDGIQVEALEGADLRVSARVLRQAELTEGGSVDLGPLRLHLLAAGDGYERGISVEIIAPLEDDSARLQGRTRIGLTGALPGRRPLAWGLAVLILLLTLVIPLADSLFSPAPEAGRMGMDLVSVKRVQDHVPMDTVWDTGPLSGPHRFLSNDCRVCHETPFVMVRDESCSGCHADVRHHAAADSHVGAELAGMRCASCHKEHNGAEPVVERDQRLCVDCHQTLDRTLPQTSLLNVSDFEPGGHPQFRPTVTVDPAGRQERLVIGSDAPPLERSNLAFPHDRHLRLSGKRGPDGVQPITCSNCHVSDGDRSFRPISMEGQCGSCHTLKLDRKRPDRQVPHAPVAQVVATVRDHFSSVVLNGDYDDVTAPAVVRRRPGTPLQPEQKAEGQAWAALKINETLNRLAGPRGCGTCHTVQPGADPASFTIAPVRLTQHWMPLARFDHSQHTSLSCVSCHAAPTSTVSTDVILPGVETCFACHGTQNAAEKVPSPCVACHGFHQSDLPLLRPAGAGGHP